MAKLIAVGVFLKQVVAMADAVEVLLNEGALYACHLPARGAFEASIYLDYILERESETRAMRFYVGNLRSQLEGARMAIPGTPEAEALARLDHMAGGPTDRSGMEPSAREQQHQSNVIFANPTKSPSMLSSTEPGARIGAIPPGTR